MSRSVVLSVLAALALSGCVEGLTPHHQGPGTVIATAHDTGHDSNALRAGEAAIVYDPDGCQGWIIDDGAEGYSGRRFDPVSGLPVCNKHFPPGTVVGSYQTESAPIRDWVPAQ